MKWWKYIKQLFLHEYTHYEDHRNTNAYKARRNVVKTWWIWFGVAVLVLLQFPNMYGIIVAGVLGMTFLSFAFLDEWRQFRENNDCDDE